MIEVKFGDCSLCAEGHAESAPYGADLVCCAVSTLAYTLAANLREIRAHDLQVWMDSGKSDIRCEPSFDARQVFHMIYVGLKLLAESYPNNIKIIEPLG